MDRKENIRNAYRLTGSNNFYDGMVTCSTVSGKAVCRLVWDMGKEECGEYLNKAFTGVPEDFAGKLLEVPVGTGILTMPLYQTLPGHDPKKEYDAIEAYLKTYSDQTIRNIFWSGNNYVLPKTPAKIGTKITYWYGDEEKKDRRSNIRFIKHYFPQARIHGIPKMAHAELVMIYPEEFCRYFDKFMCR